MNFHIMLPFSHGGQHDSIKNSELILFIHRTGGFLSSMSHLEVNTKHPSIAKVKKKSAKEQIAILRPKGHACTEARRHNLRKLCIPTR
jgi:hypothetical protein